MRGKKVFSPRAEDRITENSIMATASLVNRHKQVSKDMVHIHSSSRTFCNMNSVPEKLKMGIRNCLPTNDFPKVPIAGRLKHFSKAWKKLIRDQSILDLVDGYAIPFQRKPSQSKIPFQLATNRE